MVASQGLVSESIFTNPACEYCSMKLNVFGMKQIVETPSRTDDVRHARVSPVNGVCTSDELIEIGAQELIEDTEIYLKPQSFLTFRRLRQSFWYLC